MPRKKQRFNKLFDELRGIGGTPTGTGRTTEFFKYLTGQKKLTQDNKVPPEARKLYEIALLPFALSADSETPENRYTANISAYSLAGLTSRANANEDDFGIYRKVGGEQEDQNYFPALLKAKYDSTGSTVNESKESGITGETYRYKYGRTFSFPFGRTTEAIDAADGTAETVVDDADELDVLTTLQDKLKSGTGTQEVQTLSYEPEVFKNASTGTPFETGDTVTGIDVS